MGIYAEIQESVVEALTDAEAANFAVFRFQDYIDPITGDAAAPENAAIKSTFQPLKGLSLPISSKTAKQGFEKHILDGVPKGTKLFLTSAPIVSEAGWNESSHIDRVEPDDVIFALDGRWLVTGVFSFQPNGQEHLFNKILAHPFHDLGEGEQADEQFLQVLANTNGIDGLFISSEALHELLNITLVELQSRYGS